MHTKDMLAEEMLKLGLTEMAAAARTGYYHDYLSPLALPEMQLMTDLAEAASKRPDQAGEIMALRRRCINGDFDANTKESDEWAQSAEGREAFGSLTGKK
jgi:hypothetical protein